MSSTPDMTWSGWWSEKTSSVKPVSVALLMMLCCFVKWHDLYEMPQHHRFNCYFRAFEKYPVYSGIFNDLSTCDVYITIVLPT